MSLESQKATELIETNTRLTDVFLNKEEAIEAKIDAGIIEFSNEITDIYANKMRMAFAANQQNIWDRLALLPSGGTMAMTLVEDIVWDRDIVKDNVHIIINANGNKLLLKEKNYQNGTPFYLV